MAGRNRSVVQDFVVLAVGADFGYFVDTWFDPEFFEPVAGWW